MAGNSAADGASIPGRFQFGIARVTRFYVPQLLQAFSQSLTYPLVAGIVTRCDHGVHALTAFSQGQMIMFMVGALGGGLVTTGLVFARTWYGYLSYKRLTWLMMFALLALQCLPAVPPLNRWIFEGLFNLPGDLAEISRWTLVFGVAMNGAFFLRNISTVVLFNNLESGKANNATLLRIVATLACSAFFPRLGWTGPWWGLVALTLGVFIEYGVTEWYARPYIRDLKARFGANVNTPPPHGEIVRLTLEQFRFTLPLSLGGFLLATSPLFVAAFVSRSADAATMLAIHYVTIGVANPVGFAGLRMQQVAIKFPPEYPGDRRLLLYAIVAGLLLGVLPLAFSTPHHRHRALQQLAGEAEADGGDVAGLLAAEQVAGTAQLQVTHGEVEAAAQRTVAPNRGKALARIAVHESLGRQEQIGVALTRTAADTTAQLVEVGEAEGVRAVNKDGIGAGDVDAALDDRGREQHVGLAALEGTHLARKRRRIHLTVGDNDARLRTERRQASLDAMDGRHAVMEEIDLSAARQFLLDGRTDRFILVADDARLDGHPFARRRTEQREIARTGH